MINDIILPFLAVGLAELGDKTQLTIFFLASGTKKHFRLLLGVILAFIVADGIAIALGSYINNLIPLIYIKIGSGVVFIIFGILTLLNRKEDEEKCELKTPFLSGFGMVLLSELGDKTQIASGLFAAKFNPYFVFIGVISALAILSVLAVYAGKLISFKINKKTLSTFAGILFILIGLYCFF